jgi:DNA-binding response OmpR family regulator
LLRDRRVPDPIRRGKSPAEELLEELKPDLAVIDLMMEQNDDGFVLATGSEEVPGCPVIMVTAGHQRNRDRLHVRPDTGGWMKADALLQKPVRFEQLEAQIKRLCRG